MMPRFSWRVDFIEELAGSCVCEKEASLSPPVGEAGGGGEEGIPRLVELVLCFLAGCASVKVLEVLWSRVLKWWQGRLERYLAALEKRVTVLVESEAWEAAHALLEEGLATLVRSRNGTPGEDRDIAALKHLQAKVCMRRQDWVRAEVLLREIATAYELAWGEDRHLAAVLEDLGSAVGSQAGREREGVAILGSAMRIHTSTVRDEDLSADLSRLADNLNNLQADAGGDSLLCTPSKHSISSSTPNSRSSPDSPAVARLKSLVEFMSERMEKRKSSPNTITAIEPEAWSSP